MDALLNLLSENLPLLISGVIVPLVSWYIKKKVDNERLQQTLLRLNEAVMTGVGHAGQTYVRAIKRGREDGHLTLDEKREAKTMAIVAARESITPKLRKEVNKLIGDFDSVLSTRIEAKIAENKNGK